MSFITLSALAGAMLLLAITPGPGVFATVARALASGFRYSAVVVAGIITGDLIFLLAAVYGLAAVAEHLHGLFQVIKFLGAGYLIYLGIQLWKKKQEPVAIDAAERASWQSSYLTGLFITLSNPKVILFYLGFLPTFVDMTSLTVSDIASIALIVSLVLGATLLIYGYTAASARNLFQSRKAQRLLDRSAGSVMIATGAILASKA